MKLKGIKVAKFKELVADVRKKMNDLIPATYAVDQVVAEDISLEGQKQDEFGRYIIEHEGQTLKALVFRGTDPNLESYDLALCINSRDIVISQGALAGTTYEKGKARAWRLIAPGTAK